MERLFPLKACNKLIAQQDKPVWKDGAYCYGDIDFYVRGQAKVTYEVKDKLGRRAYSWMVRPGISNDWVLLSLRDLMNVKKYCYDDPGVVDEVDLEVKLRESGEAELVVADSEGVRTKRLGAREEGPWVVSRSGRGILGKDWRDVRIVFWTLVVLVVALLLSRGICRMAVRVQEMNRIRNVEAYVRSVGADVRSTLVHANAEASEAKTEKSTLVSYVSEFFSRISSPGPESEEANRTHHRCDPLETDNLPDPPSSSFFFRSRVSDLIWDLRALEQRHPQVPKRTWNRIYTALRSVLDGPNGPAVLLFVSTPESLERTQQIMIHVADFTSRIFGDDYASVKV